MRIDPFRVWVVGGWVQKNAGRLHITCVTLARDEREAIQRCDAAIKDGGVAGPATMVEDFRTSLRQVVSGSTARESEQAVWIDELPSGQVLHSDDFWPTSEIRIALDPVAGKTLRSGATALHGLEAGQVWGGAYQELLEPAVQVCGIVTIHGQITSDDGLRAMRRDGTPCEAIFCLPQSLTLVVPGRSFQVVQGLVQEALHDQIANAPNHGPWQDWHARTVQTALRHRLYRLDLIYPGESFVGASFQRAALFTDEVDS